MLRTLWFFAVLITTVIWYAGGVVIAGVLRVPYRPGGIYDRAAGGWARAALWAARVPYRVIGLEHLPHGRPIVVASNHQSWFDFFLLAAALPMSVRFVAKKEMQKIPLLGRAMRFAGHIYIDRQNRQAAFGAYDEAAQVIRGGMSAVIFPEGTRSRTGDLLPFKKGPFVLAIAAQAPVVPAYCAGTFTLLRKGSLRIRPHPIALMFGPPIPTEGLTYDDREHLQDQTRRAIERLCVDATSVPG